MANLSSGHTSSELLADELEEQLKYFEAYKLGLVRLHPGGWIFTKPFLNFADKYYKYQFQQDDVLLMTYPKCGSFWMQEILWTMRNNPDLRHSLSHLPIFFRVPFFEGDFLGANPYLPDVGPDDQLLQYFYKICPNKNPMDGLFLQMTEACPKPRTIRTHLQFSLLNPNLINTCKVIYVARNPKDVVVSYWHHSRIFRFHAFKGEFEDFFDFFINDKLLHGPYWLHLKEAWQKKSHPNLHFVFYEDLKSNPIAEIKRLDQFIGTKLTQQQIENVRQHTTFEEMQKREMRVDDKTSDNLYVPEVAKELGGFFRKGKVGSYSSQLTAEQETKLDKWIKKHLKDTGITFK